LSAECTRCGRPTDGTVCHPEASALADALGIAAGHAEDAETVIARQARYGGGSRGGSDEPLPVDLTASARLDAVENTIGTWARHVVDARGTELPARRPRLGPTCERIDCGHGSCLAIALRRPPRTLAAAAGWLSTQVEWLRHRPEAGEAFDELHDACTQLARLVDRPPDRDLVGMCDCGKVLYAAHGRTLIQCPQPRCKLVWHVERSRDILRRALDDKLFTAAEAARLLVHLDDGDRGTEQIRKLINKWAERGRITADGEIGGEPVYRFGDLGERLAGATRRTARVAEDERLSA